MKTFLVVSLLCVVAFSVLCTTQGLPSPRLHGSSGIMTGEEVQEMKMVNMLLNLLQIKEMAKAMVSRQPPPGK